ncbi:MULTISPECIES: restriction endonuclease subunit S [Helicobacter]|uniref:restriction endonuclease subunit S n=3 Tax=Helicobacteraceae TaxID=72293 RepID=UPI00260B17BA|nr:restriction endonuclease subunit S [Helicobacter sp. UBA3407]
MPSNPFQNLPQGWEIKTLGECLEYEQPTKYIVKNTQYSNEYEIPVLTAGKSFLLGYTNDTENIFTQTPVIIFDDFTTDSKFVDFHFKVKSSAMKILHATKIANIKFVFYFMQTIQYRSDTHKRYWISEYAKLPIPLPPIEVQKAIVEKLENAFAHIDEAVRHLKSVQTNIPHLKSSLLHCTFSGKLTESQNSSHKVQTLKSVVGVEGETLPFEPPHPLIKTEIPQGWEVKTLGEVFKVIGGGTPSTANPNFWSGNIAWITSANIENENFTIIPKKFINQNAIQASATNLVPKNTIIVVTRVGLGKVGITDVETCFSQDSQALLPLIDLNVKFMAFQIKNKAQNFIISSRGTTINGITKDTLKKVALKIPPIATQNQIVQILESKFAHLEKLAQFVNESLENLQKLKSSLLNQAFKGELIC